MSRIHKLYSELSRNTRTRNRNINKFTICVETAGNLIYSALQDSRCREIKQYMREFLDDERKSIHFQEFYEEFHKLSAPSLYFQKKPRAITYGGGGGGADEEMHKAKVCIITGMMILLISISIFLINIQAENAHYNRQCADLSDILNSGRRVNSFFDNVYKLSKMLVNREQLAYCKRLRERQGKYMFDFVESVQKTTSDFTSIITTVGSIMTFLITLLSGGIKALVCLAASFVNNTGICGVKCEEMTGRKTAVVVKPIIQNDEDEDEY
jgi:hypothetical protein